MQRYFLTYIPVEEWHVQQVKICKSRVVSAFLKSSVQQLFLAWNSRPLPLDTETHVFCMVVPKKYWWIPPRECLHIYSTSTGVLAFGVCFSQFLKNVVTLLKKKHHVTEPFHHSYPFFEIAEDSLSIWDFSLVFPWFFFPSPIFQEKNVQIVDTTCPWVSKVGVLEQFNTHWIRGLGSGIGVV